jgi:hypothetical protein
MVASAKQYRMAVHAGLIRRRPGRYPLAVLASRIGVSKRTVRDYNKRLGIIVTPNFRRCPISMEDLNSLDWEMPEDKRGGLFWKMGRAALSLLPSNRGRLVKPWRVCYPCQAGSEQLLLA